MNTKEWRKKTKNKRIGAESSMYYFQINSTICYVWSHVNIVTYHT
jgi:hypothetical protein